MATNRAERSTALPALSGLLAAAGSPSQIPTLSPVQETSSTGRIAGDAWSAATDPAEGQPLPESLVQELRGLLTQILVADVLQDRQHRSISDEHESSGTQPAVGTTQPLRKASVAAPSSRQQANLQTP